MLNNDQRPITIRLPDPDGREINLEKVRQVIRTHVSKAIDLFNNLECKVEEILDEAIEKLWIHIEAHGSQDILNLQKYLEKIAYHVYIEAFRKEKKVSQQMIPLALIKRDEQGDLLNEPLDESNQPETALIQQERVNEIYKLIDQLSPTSREIILQRIKGLSLKQMAKRARKPLDEMEEILKKALDDLEMLL